MVRDSFFNAPWMPSLRPTFSSTACPLDRHPHAQAFGTDPPRPVSPRTRFAPPLRHSATRAFPQPSGRSVLPPAPRTYALRRSPASASRQLRVRTTAVASARASGNVLRTSALSAFTTDRHSIATTPPIFSHILLALAPGIPHASGRWRSLRPSCAGILPPLTRLAASGDIATLMPSASLRSSSARPSASASPVRASHVTGFRSSPSSMSPPLPTPLSALPAACFARLPSTPSAVPSTQSPWRLPPVGFSGTHSPSLVPSVCPSSPHGAALVLTPHASPMLVAPFAPLAPGSLRKHRPWPPDSCWFKRMSHRYTLGILPLAMQGYAWLTPVHGRYTLLATCNGHRCTPGYGSLRRHPRPGTPEQAPYWARS